MPPVLHNQSAEIKLNPKYTETPLYIEVLGWKVCTTTRHADYQRHHESRAQWATPAIVLVKYGQSTPNWPGLGEITGTEEENITGLQIKVNPKTPDEMKLRKREEKEAVQTRLALFDNPKLRPLWRAKEAAWNAIADAKAPETTELDSMRQWVVKLSKAHLTASVLQQPCWITILKIMQTKTTSLATNDDDQDKTSFQRPPIIEGEEVDIVLAAREDAQYLISKEEGYRCYKCALYTHCNPVLQPVLDSVHKLEQHMFVFLLWTRKGILVSTVQQEIFHSAAAKHRALQKTHEISMPLTTKYMKYKNTQTARSNAVNGHDKNANANEMLGDYLETVGEVELMGGRKHLIGLIGLDKYESVLKPSLCSIMEGTHFDKLVTVAEQILVLFVYKAFEMRSFLMFSAGGASAGKWGGMKAHTQSGHGSEKERQRLKKRREV
ncbi:hypothetical protein B0H13DRAFT_1930250 [Mycena leptocephala]|nr:hypothetical protein B0H13DRAFT_1930250 [Mycena leptocephala]